MDKRNSYEFVFFELLKFIENIQIAYQHRALVTTFDDGITFNGNSQWCLNLVAISGASTREFKGRLQEVTNSKIEYIKDNRIDLFGFYDYFLECLENNIENIVDLQSGNVTMEQLINRKIIVPKYLGYLPLNEHSELYYLNITNSPKEAEYDENSYEELHRISSSYLNILIYEINRLILFLKHEINLVTTQRQQLKKQEYSQNFIDLIKLAKHKELFEKLNSSTEYQDDLNIILLSSRYHSLNKNNIQNIIDTDEYNRQLSKLNRDLMQVLLQEK